MLKLSKKQLLSALFILVVSCTCFAQDIIITKDSKKINAKVLRIGEDNIRYKDYNDQEGPSYSILKKDVSSILYASGEVETFNSEATSSQQMQEPANDGNRTYTKPANVQKSNVGSATATDNHYEKSPAQIDGKATVYIIRNSSIGSLIKMSVECNGMKIGSTKAKQYVYTVVDPGSYTFVSKTPENSGSLNLTLESGKTYYIKQQVKMGIVVARTGLELMNDLEGKKALNDCKLSSDNLYVMPERNNNNEDFQVTKPVVDSYQNPVQSKGGRIIIPVNEDQSLTQSNVNKSNGTLEIISIHAPDSVTFIPAKGIEIQSWKLEVYLISESTTLEARYYAASGETKLSPSGQGIFSDRNESVSALFINAPADFKTQKIKFVVDGQEMIFDLDKNEWEKTSK